jgi:PGF-CTERM protein
MNGDITGLELVDLDADMNPGNEFVLFIDEEFELEGWNTVRLSTPEGEYADENPQVQLPAPGIGFALIAMLGAAMLAGRRNE